MGARLRSVYGQVSTVATDVYTNSTNQGAAISMIQVTNTSASNRSITLSISNDAGATYGVIASNIVVPPSTAVGLITGTLNIFASNRIRLVAASGSAGDCTYVISMMEYSLGS